MRIFVLASGEASRLWGMPKQLLVFGRETILSRLKKQLDVRGLPGILVTHVPELRDAWEPAPVLVPGGHRWLVETMLNACGDNFPKSRTVVLLGDTLYSRESLNRLLLDPEDVLFLGNGRELYGVAWEPETNLAMIEALRVEVDQAEAGDLGKLQTLYWRVSGLPYNTVREPGLPLLSWVTDWTRDIDTPEDYNAAQGLISRMEAEG